MTSTSVQPVAALPRGCSNFRLRQLSRRVARFYDVEFAQAGIKGTQYSLMTTLSESGPVRPGDLSRRLGMDASTLTRNLRLLIDQGWVEQGPGPDARSRTIVLTAAGRDKLAEAKRCWKKAQIGLNKLLGADKVVALHALLDEGLAILASQDPDADN